MTKLSIVMPCYFNEANLPFTFQELLQREADFPSDVESEYVFVDDGSSDNTLQELLKIRDQRPNQVQVIKLAKNVGAYNAILAGFQYASGDCTTVLTADLQDPPELIPKMFDYWRKGVKLVIANREDRQEPILQKLISNTFHKLMKRFALRNIPDGGFDLVLFDRELRKKILEMNEQNAHTLYLLAWLGYDYVTIPYVRRKREVGKSRWTLSKKLKLFIDSFVSFSFFPIRVLSGTGIILGILAVLYAFYLIFARLSGLVEIRGWTALMVVLLFVSAFQMIGLGILGEYIWRTLDAARARPNFIVDERWGPGDDTTAASTAPDSTASPVDQDVPERE